MQNINSLQNNHKVKRLGLGNKEKNDEINFETRNKPKVNFIIGVFLMELVIIEIIQMKFIIKK